MYWYNENFCANGTMLVDARELDSENDALTVNANG